MLFRHTSDSNHIIFLIFNNSRDFKIHYQESTILYSLYTFVDPISYQQLKFCLTDTEQKGRLRPL